MASIKKSVHLPSHQDGVVLFIALIVLVAMSLAGIAMNRSVDVAMGISGNLAFRQSTLQGAEKAISDAVTWIENNRDTSNFNTNNSAVGYKAASAALEPNWLMEASWIDAFSDGSDAVGNRLQYIIERVCSPTSNGLAYNDTDCLLGEPPTAARVGNGIAAGNFQFQPPPTLAFRITARAVGPKKTTSIVQSYYLIPM